MLRSLSKILRRNIENARGKEKFRSSSNGEHFVDDVSKILGKSYISQQESEQENFSHQQSSPKQGSSPDLTDEEIEHARENYRKHHAQYDYMKKMYGKDRSFIQDQLAPTNNPFNKPINMRKLDVLQNFLYNPIFATVPDAQNLFSQENRQKMFLNVTNENMQKQALDTQEQDIFIKVLRVIKLELNSNKQIAQLFDKRKLSKWINEVLDRPGQSSTVSDVLFLIESTQVNTTSFFYFRRIAFNINYGQIIDQERQKAAGTIQQFVDEMKNDQRIFEYIEKYHINPIDDLLNVICGLIGCNNPNKIKEYDIKLLAIGKFFFKGSNKFHEWYNSLHVLFEWRKKSIFAFRARLLCKQLESVILYLEMAKNEYFEFVGKTALDKKVQNNEATDLRRSIAIGDESLSQSIIIRQDSPPKQQIYKANDQVVKPQQDKYAAKQLELERQAAFIEKFETTHKLPNYLSDASKRCAHAYLLQLHAAQSTFYTKKAKDTDFDIKNHKTFFNGQCQWDLATNMRLRVLQLIKQNTQYSIIQESMPKLLEEFTIKDDYQGLIDVSSHNTHARNFLIAIKDAIKSNSTNDVFNVDLITYHVNKLWQRHLSHNTLMKKIILQSKYKVLHEVEQYIQSGISNKQQYDMYEMDDLQQADPSKKNSEKIKVYLRAQLFDVRSLTDSFKSYIFSSFMHLVKEGRFTIGNIVYHLVSFIPFEVLFALVVHAGLAEAFELKDSNLSQIPDQLKSGLQGLEKNQHFLHMQEYIEKKLQEIKSIQKSQALDDQVKLDILCRQVISALYDMYCLSLKNNLTQQESSYDGYHYHNEIENLGQSSMGASCIQLELQGRLRMKSRGVQEKKNSKNLPIKSDHNASRRDSNSSNNSNSTIESDSGKTHKSTSSTNLKLKKLRFTNNQQYNQLSLDVMDGLKLGKPLNTSGYSTDELDDSGYSTDDSSKQTRLDRSAIDKQTSLNLKQLNFRRLNSQLKIQQVSNQFTLLNEQQNLIEN